MKIEIITRCTRPSNLYQVRDSIFKNTPEEIHIKWRIVFDTSALDTIPTSIIEDFSSFNLHFWKGTQGDFAHMLINRAIDLVDEDAWFYILDDDNEMHPSMLELVLKAHKEDPMKGGMLFSQFIGGKDFTGLQVRQIDATNIKVREIDMAQFFLSKKLVGDKRLNPMQSQLASQTKN